MKKSSTFEENLARLEEIVAALDDERLPLEEAMKLFAEGVKLSQGCGKTLDEAKLRLEELSLPMAGNEQ